MQVRVQRLERPVDVTVLESIDDPRVLDQDVLQVLGRLRLAEPHEPCESTHLFEQARDDRELRPPCDEDVELLVEHEERLLVVGVCGPALAHEREAENVDLLQRHHTASGLDRDLLERLPDPQDLVPVLDGEPAHEELAPGPDLEQAFRPE